MKKICFFPSSLLVVMLENFSCLYWLFNLSHELTVYSPYIFIDLFIFFLLICRCNYYILYINPLFYMTTVNHFSYVPGVITLLTVF